MNKPFLINFGLHKAIKTTHLPWHSISFNQLGSPVVSLRTLRAILLWSLLLNHFSWLEN